MVRVYSVIIGWMVGFKNSSIVTKQSTNLATIPQGYAPNRSTEFIEFESNSGADVRYVFHLNSRSAGGTISVQRMANSDKVANFNYVSFVSFSTESFTAS